MQSFLDEKYVLVTGASGGVGRAIAEGLANQGARLLLVGRRLDVLNKLADGLRARAAAVDALRVDLTVAKDIRQLAAWVKKRYKRLDVLIHGAGTIHMGRIESARIDDFDAQYLCNARAPYALTRAMLPLLRKSKGQVVFVNSIAGLLVSRPDAGAYAASKHALKAIADTLRHEVNADGVRVLSLYLGRTATQMQKKVFRQERRRYQSEILLQPGDVAKVLIPLLSLPPNAEVTDLALRPLMKTYLVTALVNSCFWPDAAKAIASFF